MEILIAIGLIILIIYGIVKLIIWIAPYVATGILYVLGAGGVVGLIVGVFYGIRNYMLSIYLNIENRAFKISMIFITSLIIILILLYLAAIAYYLYNYFN